MRTEYTIQITDKKGKKDQVTYAKSIVMGHYNKCKAFYEPKGCRVELYKTLWIGNSFYKAEKIESV